MSRFFPKVAGPALPVATAATPGLFAPGTDFVFDAGAGKWGVDGPAPVASSTGPVAATALVDITGHSFTLQQIAAEIASINGSAGSASTTPTGAVAATAASALVGVPSSVPVGTTIGGTYNGAPYPITTTLTPSGSTAWSVRYNNGADVGTRAALLGSALPPFNLSSIASSGCTLRIYSAQTGGVLLQESAPITVTASATPTSTAFASPLTFAGPVGAPTGLLALTGANASSYSLDGSGGMVVNAPAWSGDLLVAAGVTPAVGTITVTPKAASAMRLGRLDATGQNGGYMTWDGGGYFSMTNVVNGVATDISLNGAGVFDTGVSFYTWASFGIRMDANGNWHPQVNGADINPAGGLPTWTPPAVAQGYIEIGSGFQGGAVISQITVQ